MSSTILVSGGAGFIGSHVARALLERGDTVRVLDDLSTGKRENLAAVAGHIDFHVGDVRDQARLAILCRGADAVVHLAAIASVTASFERPVEVEGVNVGGTLAVMTAARRYGVRRVVFASSCAVYGEPLVVPVSEAQLPVPGSPYAVSKLAGEGYLRVLGTAAGERRGDAPHTVALRFFNVYGPRQDAGSEYSGVIARFVAAARAGEPLTVFGDGLQTRDFVYVADVARAVLLALGTTAGVGRAVNVGSGVQTTLLDLAAAVCGASGVPLRVVHEPPRQGEIRRSAADTRLACELLGYRPTVPLVEGVAATVAWQAESV